eukprot:TRINITY_DN1685_c0_g1_i1.p3 TRINITY_DN1685_c0_g1~~TRINITY_DN1685_c0_g1_i1.p3  ORF type:complete len:267 (-),score=21.61 TRINITY_DN1685_c0_g1_i1:829-1629(-)
MLGVIITYYSDICVTVHSVRENINWTQLQKFNYEQKMHQATKIMKAVKRCRDDIGAITNQCKKMKLREVYPQSQPVMITIPSVPKTNLKFVKKENRRRSSSARHESVKTTQKSCANERKRTYSVGPNRIKKSFIEVIPELINEDECGKTTKRRSRSQRIRQFPSQKSLLFKSASEKSLKLGQEFSLKLRQRENEKIERIRRERQFELEKKAAAEEARAKQEAQFRARTISKGKPIIIKKSTAITIPESPKLRTESRALQRAVKGAK